MFLAALYLFGCVGEAILVKGGPEQVFQSIEKFVPHMVMFILGLYFSRK
jgi:hypothetical protein